MPAIPEACPHCETALVKWLVPEDASWSEAFFFACFNNECSYYKKGWDWMWKEYKQKASYRYAINPTTGSSFPLPVWSDEATRQMIVGDAPGEAT